MIHSPSRGLAVAVGLMLAGFSGCHSWALLTDCRLNDPKTRVARGAKLLLVPPVVDCAPGPRGTTPRLKTEILCHPGFLEDVRVRIEAALNGQGFVVLPAQSPDSPDYRVDFDFLFHPGLGSPSPRTTPTKKPTSDSAVVPIVTCSRWEGGINCDSDWVFIEAPGEDVYCGTHNPRTLILSFFPINPKLGSWSGYATSYCLSGDFQNEVDVLIKPLVQAVGKEKRKVHNHLF